MLNDLMAIVIVLVLINAHSILNSMGVIQDASF